MPAFPKEFFSGETRDGFYIEPMMKRAWAAQLEVLAVIGQICNTHGLRYFADWGTLLGAVRHQGFIPWDDDMDICMLREDYDSFLSAAAGELPDGYRILNLDTNAEWDEVFARIVNAGTVSYDGKRLSEFHGCPYIVGVDIFPLDELPEDPQQECRHTELFSTVYSSGRLYTSDPSGIEELLPDLEDLCNTRFSRDKDIRNQLLRAADAIAKRYCNSGSPVITNLAEHSLKKHFLRKEWYKECVYLPFEHLQLPAPSGYDAVLRALYGDYRTPVRDASSHNYPFYRQQQEMYEQSSGSQNSLEQQPL